MKVTRLFTETRAASSVIGTVLIVALVVILSASVGTFVVGFGDEVEESPPKASFSMNQSTEVISADGSNYATYSTVTVTHEGGDSIDKENIRLTVNGEQAWGVELANPGASTPEDADDEVVPLWSGSGAVDSGSSVTVAVVNETASSGDKFWVYNNSGYTEPYPLVLETDNPTYSMHLEPGDTVQVIWEAESDDSTATLATYTVT